MSQELLTGVKLTNNQPRLSERARQVMINDMTWLVLIALVAIAIRIYSLRFFDVISTDGTTYAITAKQILNGDFRGIAISGIYPCFVAIAGLIIDDIELAGRLVSIFFGILLLIPLYLIGKELFSHKAALLTCLVAAVNPSFVFYSCEVMTQSTYVTIQLAGLLLIWRLFHRQDVITGILAGIMIGLTYMTRPEGLLLFFVLPFFPLIFSFRQTLARWQPVAAYLAAFSLLFLLNILLVYSATGEWQVSAKTDSALNDALSYYLNIPDINYIPGYDPRNYLEIIRDYPGFLPKNLATNLKTAWNTILPPWQWFLAFAGFCIGGFSRDTNLKRLYLLTSFAPLAVIAVFYYIDPSYVISYQPVLFLLILSALCRAEQFVLQKLPIIVEQPPFPLTRPALVLVVFYAFLMLKPQIRADVSDEDYTPSMDDARRAEKHIGLILKEHLPPGKILTRWARIAFYADREWMMVPSGIYLEEVVKMAKDQGVRFLIADGLLYGVRPGMGKEIFSPLINPKIPDGLTFNNTVNRNRKLYPIFVFKHPRSIGVVVYDLAI